jgi:parallel beta-helix repeat protein
MSAAFVGLIVLNEETTVSAVTRYVGGSGGGNFTTIQDAINVSIDGDTVFVYNKTYNESITVNRTINLIGMDKSNTTIDGLGGFNTVRITSDWVNITGFTITNASNGIVMLSSNNTIANNNVSSNTQTGILGDFSNNNYINWNLLSMNGWYGVVFNFSVGNGIQGNVITNNGIEGVRLYMSNDNNVTNNAILSNPTGVSIVGSSGNSIFNNNFIGNSAHAFDDGTNFWNMPSFIGGNFWDTWTFPDDNCDGFVDFPFMIPGGSNQDNLPFTEESAWMSGWFNKSAFANYAPSGMPDFDQREKSQRTLQNYWMTMNAGPDGILDPFTLANIQGDDVLVNATPGAYNISLAPGLNHVIDTPVIGDDTVEFSYCGPTAAANALWWLDSRYADPFGVPGDAIDTYSLVQDMFPGDDHLPANVPYVIEDLAVRFNTINLGDTNASAMVDGLNQLIAFAGLSSNLSVSNESFPDFPVVANELRNCNAVILFLGFYDDEGTRVYGHIVTMSGVDEGGFKVAISDPIKNVANPLITYSSYNDTINVSHDIYDVMMGPPHPSLPPPTWWLMPYTSGYNFPPPPLYWAVVENVVYIKPLSASVPTEPLGLSESSGDSYVNLTWSPPSDDGGSAIIGYNIYRDGSFLGFVTDLWYNDTTVTNGITYIYNVTAVNGVGEGPNSTGVSATPMGVPSVPQSPGTSSGDGYVNLTWTAPASDGGSVILLYNIYRNGTVGVYDTVPASQLWYNDTNVINGLTYTYNISAVNAIGEGPQTGDVSGTPTSSATVPSEPQNLGESSGSGYVNLTWTAPVSDGGSAIIGYNIYRDGSFLTFVSGQLWYNDTTVTNGVTYDYNVTAVNGVGEGPNSTGVSAMPQGVPSEPQNLLESSGDSYVNITWTAPLSDGGSAITGYNIYRDGSFVSFVTDLWFNDTTVTNGNTYDYNVSAVNALGEGLNSTGVSATPMTVPDAVENLAEDSGSSYVNLTWDVPLDDGGSSITNYYVYRNGTVGPIATLPAGQTWYNDTTVSDGITYTYNVSAVNVVGEGPNSTIMATPGVATLPSAPQNLQADSGDSYVNVSWGAPASDGGSAIIEYRVYRNDTGALVAITPDWRLWFYDTSVTNGELYSYNVSAVNAVGQGPNATITNANPLGVPSAVQNPEAIGLFEMVNITWEAPSSDGGTPITGYNLYRNGTPGVYQFIPAGQLWFNDTNVLNNTLYTYNITAVNALGESPAAMVMGTPLTTPTEPVNLQATSGSEYVHLTWSIPLNNGSTDITAFFIYRNDTNGTYATVFGDEFEFNDTLVQNGVNYTYHVAAVNAQGTGPNSTNATARPEGVPDVPGAFSADPGNSFVNLSWDEPFDGGQPITEFFIYRNGTVGPYATLSPGEVWFNDTAVTNGVVYTYTISANNNLGESDLSEEIVVMAGSVPSRPHGLTITMVGSTITITWQVPVDDGGMPITNYKVYRGTASGTWTVWEPYTTDLSYTDSAVDFGTTYYYVVTAVNFVGESDFSQEVSEVPEGVPDEPQAFSAEAFNSFVILTWNIPFSDGGLPLTGFRLYRGTTSNESEMTLLTSALGSNDLTYNDSQVTNGVTYFYWISAENSKGEGPKAPGINATPESPVVLVNEKPTVEIATPVTDVKWYGEATISGAAFDTDGTVEKVEIRFGDGDWIEANGTEAWNYKVDTEDFPNGEMIIYVRSFDGENYSNEVNVTVNIDNRAPVQDKGILEGAGLILGLIVLVLIILILFFMFLKKRKPRDEDEYEDEDEEEEEEEEDEEEDEEDEEEEDEDELEDED